MSAYVFLLVYAFIVGYAAAALFVAINRLEPNYWFARVVPQSRCQNVSSGKWGANRVGAKSPNRIC
jgi:hypothetical protein